jgi:hypothetical protein
MKGKFMPKKELVTEHTRLVGRLKRRKEAELKKEHAIQSGELQEYKQL